MVSYNNLLFDINGMNLSDELSLISCKTKSLVEKESRDKMILFYSGSNHEQKNQSIQKNLLVHHTIFMDSPYPCKPSPRNGEP